METDNLKAAWEAVKTPSNDLSVIQQMLSENNHPVLKKIRRQLTIEVVGWTFFLICYYSMLDGEHKPLWVNAILITSIILPILHSLMGYRFERFFYHDLNLRDALTLYLSKVKTYAFFSVMTRQIYLAGFLVFFGYGISFNTHKYLILAGIFLTFLIQFFVSCRIWKKRLTELGDSLKSFSL